MKHLASIPTPRFSLAHGWLALMAAPMLLFSSPFLADAQSQFMSNASAGGPSSYSSSEPMAVEPALVAGGGAGATRGVIAAPVSGGVPAFSRVAFGADISSLGIGFMTATNLSRHLNLRANGSMFNYTVDNFNTQGFNVGAKIKMASARASVDYYPFHAGFRLSPGVMFYNQNHGYLNLAVDPGQSFTLNNQTYYSATGDRAVKGSGAFGFGNGGSPAFTMTTGWGNVIPRSGRHFSFPFEVGVALIKQPTLNFNLTGYGCDKTGVYCVDVATTPQIQQNLAIQVAKYTKDIEPLKTFPIASFGVAYNFSTRRTSNYR